MADSDHTNPTARKPRRAPRSPQLVITVPQEIIDSAERSHSHTCMVAEAIRAVLPYETEVTVDAAHIRWAHPDKGVRYVFLTPYKVREKIFQFDAGEHVEAFSFHLRGAWVHAVRRRDGAKSRIKQTDWENLKSKVQKFGSGEGLKLGAIADQMGINKSTLTNALRSKDIPIAVNVDKIEKWVLERTGEKPAPRPKSQIDQVSGPVRMRSPKSTKRIEPEFIGGKAPPPAMTPWRQFGLRMFQKRPGEHD